MANYFTLMKKSYSLCEWKKFPFSGEWWNIVSLLQNEKHMLLSMKYHYFLVFQSLCNAFQITQFYGILNALVIISSCLGWFHRIGHCTSVCHVMQRNTIPAIANSLKALDDMGIFYFSLVLNSNKCTFVQFMASWANLSICYQTELQ